MYVTEILGYLKKYFRFTVIAGYSTSDDVGVRVRSVPLIGKFAFSQFRFSFTHYSLLYGRLSEEQDMIWLMPKHL